MSKALVIGHSGQDGTYLSEQLKARGYTVIGVGRPVLDKRSFDVANPSHMRRLVAESQPDEIYYLAAFHHSSEDAPMNEHELLATSLSVNTSGINNVLGAVAAESPATRVFYASSSRIFGDPASSPQNENTPLRPTCAYGISKTAGMGICSYYRSTRNIFAACGILYNHESPLRPAKFVSRKIVRAAVQSALSSTAKLTVGNLDATVDWGYAPDYVRAMWQMLQLDQPADFVIGTGIPHTVRDFVEAAFGALNLDWRNHVQENPNFLARKSAQGVMLADSSKLRSISGWQPSVDFAKMVHLMIEAERKHL